jgi:crotonobetainyl-CoA:carnitine CoA-transferase CaiB-like acyl-CoA transferase
MSPSFVLRAAEGDELRAPSDYEGPRQDPDRIGVSSTGDLVTLHHYWPLMTEAFARFGSEAWIAAGAIGGVPLQPVRSPESALQDPVLLAEGSVAEVDDPEVGPIRQVGITYRLETSPGHIAGPAPAPGQHTAEVVAEAAAAGAAHPPPGANRARTGGTLTSPLDGVVVLDLGVAVAGPFGAQVLADLGADVVKVNSLWDNYWHENHISFSCSRGKRSIAVDLKNPRGMAILHRLVQRADVVHHNMRYDAAERLGVDYESLRALNPALIYCHTRGFERSGPRAKLPGNDQMGAALAGIEWEDGACDAGGRPLWSLTSLGDTGNGFLSALAVIQALLHRSRTGEGQMVDTSIVNACLLNTSYAYVTADGQGAPRPRLDADQLGLGALYRLYETAAGWLCLAVVTEDHWAALVDALDDADLARNPRFATATARVDNDEALAERLASNFASHSAETWFKLLDAAGVPCEISSSTFAVDVWDDPELRDRGWIASYHQPKVGQMEQFGLLIDFSDTPGRVERPPLVVGEYTREILAELDIDEDEVEALIAEGIVVADDLAALS